MEIKIEVEGGDRQISLQKASDLKITIEEYVKKDNSVEQLKSKAPKGVASVGLLDNVLSIVADHPEIIKAIVSVLIAVYKHFWGKEQHETSVTITVPNNGSAPQVIVINNVEQAEALKNQLNIPAIKK